MAGDAKPDRRYLSVRGAVLIFALSALGAVVVISVAVVWVARQESSDQAVREARDLAVAEANSAVAPLLSDGVLARDPAALAGLDDVVRNRVLSSRVVRVKVWAPDGTIVYSDEPRLVGLRFELDGDERAALDAQRTDAEVSDLRKPENVFDQSSGKLLEVYVGERTPSGQKILYESYLSFSSVDATGRHTLTGLLPALIGGLAILFLIQIPLAWSLARRVERSRAEERRLLRRALEAGEIERRHLASDLHDGVVQSLVGTSLSLSAASEEADRAGLSPLSDRLDTAAGDLRQGVRDLRSLIVAIAPPRLHEEGLPAALGDLVSPLHGHGIDATLRVDHDLTLPPGTQTLLYRGAQEALRNMTRHAQARAVDVSLERVNGIVRLQVRDDGVGFSPQEVEPRRAAGHIGLELLSELAKGAGGHLEVHSAPGAGTQVRLEVPAT